MCSSSSRITLAGSEEPSCDRSEVGSDGWRTSRKPRGTWPIRLMGAFFESLCPCCHRRVAMVHTMITKALRSTEMKNAARAYFGYRFATVLHAQRTR